MATGKPVASPGTTHTSAGDKRNPGLGRLAFTYLSAEELRHIADARRLLEDRLGEERTAALAELLWDKPALGHYRRDHRPPAYPEDAPPRLRDCPGCTRVGVNT